MKKQNLPSKICTVCERPFTWRKKWEKVWDEVKYCSKRCSGNKNLKEKPLKNELPNNSRIQPEPIPKPEKSLPQKICIVCQRSFNIRKKWIKV